MRVRVLFFGRLKEIVGCAEEHLELAEGARVADLFARYGALHPELRELRASVLAAVNHDFTSWDAPLRAGDEVAFLPPVSGGAEPAGVGVAEDLFELVRAPLDVHAIVSGLRAPESGAVVVFEGCVRAHSRGRATRYLEYEAYEPMALRKMREIGAALRARFPIARLAIVHRLGRLEVGETSLLIAVSAVHRREAFDACRAALEALKRTVPIWKKEFFADGSAWAEGELPTAPTTRPDAESNFW
ncbi:MAG: molybdopterin converting factor subunit 1 [Firmicutes bacterium]|nr:molybdopterin converting factor subunit 1 [Bacillota bacterium]